MAESRPARLQRSAPAPGSNPETACYIGLGANLGDSLGTLRRAADDLNALPESRITARSRIYRSAPIGPAGQDDYLNAVLELTTRLSAEALLDEMQRIETSEGRIRIVRWGPRTLDLDLLLYGGRHISSPRLTVPHPRIAERNFVLMPLIELLGEEHLLAGGPPLGELLSGCPDNPLEKTSLHWKDARNNQDPTLDGAMGEQEKHGDHPEVTTP